MKHHPIKFFRDHKILERPQQKAVIDAVHENWDKYTYFCLSLPTGVGKSYIACAIADSLTNAYMLTSTLQLQTQYESSWDKIVNLKGRSNYKCNLNREFTVDAAPCTANSDLIRQCKISATCDYYNQRDLAFRSQAFITNPVYLLYSAHCGFAKDEEESPWIEREVMIIDEAHNIEKHLIQFAESDIDPKHLSDDLDVDVGHLQFTGDVEQDYQTVIKIRDELYLKAEELKEKIEKEFPRGLIEGANLKEWARGITKKVAEKVQKLNARAYMLDKELQPLNIFFNTHDTPEELLERWLISKVPDQNVLKLAPLYGNFLFTEYLGRLARKFVFLSATLGTKSAFCRELGIDPELTLFMETESPFKPEKSPIVSLPAIKLSKDVYGENVKQLGGLIDSILDMHPKQRGIIHSVTYDIAREIFNGVSALNKKRLVCRDMDVLAAQKPGSYPRRYKNEELLQLHESRGKDSGSVLLSPSMMEGVDLHDDLSEFQVIIKLPWSNLGDQRVKIKSKLDEEWYANKMWVAVMQAAGRSTRHEEDMAVTYILDKNFVYFYDLWKHQLPAWFKDRLVF